MIPFGALETDGSTFDPAISRRVENVQPKKGGWGPFPAHSPLSGALASTCYGATTTLNSSDTYAIFAATASGLYKYNTGTTNWDDFTTTATTYALPSQDYWSMHQWGDNLLAGNSQDGLYKLDLLSGTEFAQVSNAPIAKYYSNVGNFVVAANINGNPTRVQWSQYDDVDNWTVGTAQAGYQDLPDGGEIRGIINGELGAFILQQRAIRRMTFEGGEWVFRFDKVMEQRGCAAPGSLVNAGEDGFFFLDTDGFYRYGPGGLSPIGAEKENRAILDEVDLDLLYTVQGAADPVNKMVWWIIPRSSSDKFLLGYDWQLGQWSRVEDVMDFVFSASTPAMDLSAVAAIWPTLSSVPYPMGSRVWKGGQPTFAGVDTDNKMGYFAGTNMQATLETADVAQAGPDGRALVTGFRVITDASGHTGQIGAKDNHSDTISWNSATSPNGSTGLIPSRVNGRLHRYRAIITAGETWNYVHGVEPIVRRAGRR